jgi:uncharacterized DUF497 family protein
VYGFDWDRAVEAVDERIDYGETRYQVLGSIGGRAYILLYTLRRGIYRVISLRKANRREQR